MVSAGGGTPVTGQLQANLKQIDELHAKADWKGAYELAKRTHEEEPKNVEVAWRFARAAYSWADVCERKNGRRKALIAEGYRAAVDAHTAAPTDSNCCKWAAMCTGLFADNNAGSKEKIGKYLDQALALNPKDHLLLHARGHFSYSVANLTWFERKAAATFFTAPPTATVDEALQDFLEVEKLRPEWIDNLLHIARCFVAKQDKQKAAHYLQLAVKVDPHGHVLEEEALDEAKKLLKSLSK
ncbi:Tetratricopeptide repeat protein [Aphelenchoides fujianensis]|nr:Tetratricopeptide repeat protein [Aphelenchoides fujianensis]